uniref:Uncharacterized protein n=1 Tax=Brassica oleracea var. oleracea TaxID=109376 RepID=A0A0D3AHU9_BRAOL
MVPDPAMERSDPPSPKRQKTEEETTCYDGRPEDFDSDECTYEEMQLFDHELDRTGGGYEIDFKKFRYCFGNKLPSILWNDILHLIPFQVNDTSDNLTKPYRAVVRYFPGDIEVVSCNPKEMVLELRLECPPWVRVALATFPPITVRARMEDLVGISLGLPPGNPTVIKSKKTFSLKKRLANWSTQDTKRSTRSDGNLKGCVSEKDSLSMHK